MNTAEAHTDAAWFGLAREHTEYPVVARFTVEGEPESKSRVRFDARNRRTYTPDRTVAAERAMAWRFREAARGYKPDGSKSYGVVGLFFAATRQRRDVDNMLKLICDALNGLAWVDDNQVLEVAGRKSYVDDKLQARTEVLIYELPPVLPQSMPCAECGRSVPTFPSHRSIRRFCSPACRSAFMSRGRVRSCPGCGETFQRKGKRQCEGCDERARWVTSACPECHQLFTRDRSRGGRIEVSLCSDDCRAARVRARDRRRAPRNRKDET